MKMHMGFLAAALMAAASATASGRRPADNPPDRSGRSAQSGARDPGAFDARTSTGTVPGGVRPSTATINDPETFPDRANRGPADTLRQDGTAIPDRDGMGTRP